jgi:hypothetical protein
MGMLGAGIAPFTPHGIGASAGPPYGYRNWRPGINILTPTDTCNIQAFIEDESQWPENYEMPQNKRFFHIAIDNEWLVHSLVGKLCNVRKQHFGGPAKPDGWGVTEWTEKGAGVWTKGSTFRYGEEKSKLWPCSAVGWSSKRGAELPPVVLQLHKMP